MAEIVGLVASIVQIAGAGAKLSSVLYNFTTSAVRAEQDITDIASDVELTSNALESVGRVFETEDGKSIASEKAIRDANAIIKRCEDVFKDISELVEKRRTISKNGKKGLSMIGKLSWPMKEQRVELYRRKLESLKSSLQLLLAVLQLAQGQARGHLEKAALEQEREKIRELHHRQQDSLKFLQALETKLSKVTLDDEETLRGSSAPSKVPTLDLMFDGQPTQPPTADESKVRSKADDAIIEPLVTDDSEISESDTTLSGDDDEHLSIDELAQAAKHVQKLLNRITALQKTYDSNQKSKWESDITIVPAYPPLVPMPLDQMPDPPPDRGTSTLHDWRMKITDPEYLISSSEQGAPPQENFFHTAAPLIHHPHVNIPPNQNPSRLSGEPVASPRDEKLNIVRSTLPLDYHKSDLQSHRKRLEHASVASDGVRPLIWRPSEQRSIPQAGIQNARSALAGELPSEASKPADIITSTQPRDENWSTSFLGAPQPTDPTTSTTKFAPSPEISGIDNFDFDCFLTPNSESPSGTDPNVHDPQRARSQEADQARVDLGPKDESRMQSPMDSAEISAFEKQMQYSGSEFSASSSQYATLLSEEEFKQGPARTIAMITIDQREIVSGVSVTAPGDQWIVKRSLSSCDNGWNDLGHRNHYDYSDSSPIGFDLAQSSRTNSDSGESNQLKVQTQATPFTIQREGTSTNIDSPVMNEPQPVTSYTSPRLCRPSYLHSAKFESHQGAQSLPHQEPLQPTRFDTVSMPGVRREGLCYTPIIDHTYEVSSSQAATSTRVVFERPSSSQTLDFKSQYQHPQKSLAKEDKSQPRLNDQPSSKSNKLATEENHALQDYYLQLEVIRQQDKKRFLRGRQEQDLAPTVENGNLEVSHAKHDTSGAQPSSPEPALECDSAVPSQTRTPAALNPGGVHDKDTLQKRRHRSKSPASEMFTGDHPTEPRRVMMGKKRLCSGGGSEFDYTQLLRRVRRRKDMAEQLGAETKVHSEVEAEGRDIVDILLEQWTTVAES